MKHYQDYKKAYKFFLGTILLFVPFIFLHAQTIEELNQKISQKNADIAKLERADGVDEDTSSEANVAKQAEPESDEDEE